MKKKLQLEQFVTICLVFSYISASSFRKIMSRLSSWPKSVQCKVSTSLQEACYTLFNIIKFLIGYGINKETLSGKIYFFKLLFKQTRPAYR